MRKYQKSEMKNSKGKKQDKKKTLRRAKDKNNAMNSLMIKDKRLINISEFLSASVRLLENHPQS